MDNQTGNPVHPTVGKCDRANNCNHHYPPKQYFTDNHITQSKNTNLQQSLSILNSQISIKKQQPSFIDTDIFKQSLQKYQNNNLINFLSQKLGIEATTKAIETYYIGTAKNNATVFWQINPQGKIKTGKIITYDKNGHRRKDIDLQVQWVHTKLKLPNFNLSQSFFGEHLLKNTTNKVAIVESEKTAIIASIYIPQFTWLACGGSEGLNLDKCKVLTGHTIVLYPDAGMYNKWSIIAKKISAKYFCTVSVSPLIEKCATGIERQNGYDIADYLLKTPFKQPEIQPPLPKQPAQTKMDKNKEQHFDEVVNAMIAKNHALYSLINKFDCEIVQQ
jgi:hypothetical protein